jgi:hypothetical protein
MTRAAAAGMGLVVGLAALPTVARADHAPGHGASEAVRSLNSLGGGTGAAVSRIMLLQEASDSRTSTLTPHGGYVTSILGEYSPHAWFSFGVQVPLQIVDEPQVPARVGLGNLRVSTRVTLHADKLFHRILTFGVNATFPTRTVTFTTDPGRTWTTAPYAVFTRNYHRPFWQIFATVPIETRPAGTAIDLGVGAQGGYRFWGKLAPSAGLLVNTRLASWCRRVDGGADFCREGRVTEIERPLGATALYVTGGLAWTFAPWGTLAASVQVPVTAVRDFDVGGSLGLSAQIPSARRRER